MLSNKRKAQVLLFSLQNSTKIKALTLCKSVLKQLVFSQILSKFHENSSRCRFFPLLSQIKPVQASPSHFFKVHLILFSHLRLCLSSRSLQRISPPKHFMHFCYPPTCHRSHRFHLLNLVTLIIFNQLRISSLRCSFLLPLSVV